MINRFLQSYGFDSIKELALSLWPSFKYGQGGSAIAVSGVTAVIAKLLGITPVLVIGMFVAVITETVTGIRASKKKGIPFESWRFSRCVLKVMIWVAMLFFINCFYLDAEYRDGWMWDAAQLMYSLIQITTMVYFVIEYLTSIAENIAILHNKEKEAYINAIKELFASFLTLLKGKVK